MKKMIISNEIQIVIILSNEKKPQNHSLLKFIHFSLFPQYFRKSKSEKLGIIFDDYQLFNEKNDESN